MKKYPVPDPGVPDNRSAARYLLWLCRRQWQSVASGAWWGALWMVSISLMPAVLGQAIGSGIANKDADELLRWTMLALLLTVFIIVAGLCRHRSAMANVYAAEYRTVQVVTRHVVKLGATLPRIVASGEVATIGSADIMSISGGFQNLSVTVGAVGAICVVGVILFSVSVPLGLTVFVGTAVLMAMTAYLTKILHRRQSAYRSTQSQLTAMAVDITAGLRVLRGIGGEWSFSRRYRCKSQSLRRAGEQVARVQSWFDSMQVLAPKVFATVVTWLAATFVIKDELSVGDMITFYGYAAFLTLPLSVLGQAANAMTGAYVSAGRVAGFLRLEPEFPAVPAGPPLAATAATAQLTDGWSNLSVPRTGLLGVVCADAEDATGLAERLARFTDSGSPAIGGVPLAKLPLPWLRKHVVLVRNEDTLFGGPLIRELTPPGRQADRATLDKAIYVSAAVDIVNGLDDGLETVIENGAKNLSTGQQQRLRLARALAAEPATLILVEPTSAVDALTEARIAERLVENRRGRSTVVFTSSALVLDHADRVCMVKDGLVTAVGTHRELLAECPAYWAVVNRGGE
ncbi:ABC transporter transmembrane domain-containing protein [Actinophytocola glycyrrhizae]|uniref:ABC transporter transmembrane domain-containing protein n=1 Tax=Actinophytocola glycyrrhizae TaxID=2044873 RepID=A0ABV9RRG1_9PSEU